MKKFLSVGISLVLIVTVVFTLCACENQTVLDTPVNLRVEEETILRWNPVDGASEYTVSVEDNEYRCSDAQYDLSKYAHLVDGKTYSIKVKANGNGVLSKSSDFSDTIRYTYHMPTRSDQLAVPMNLRIEGDSLIKWNPVDGALRYTISIEGNEYVCEQESYDMLSYAYLADGKQIAVKVRANGNTASMKNSDFSDPIYFTYHFKVPVEQGAIISDSRYEAVSAPLSNHLPIIVDSVTDCTYNYYVLDVGYVKNVPISSGITFYYNGVTPMTVMFQQSDVTERTVETSLSQTLSQTVSETVMNEAGVSLTVGTGDFLSKFIKVEVEGHYTRTWGGSTERTNSMTNTFITADTTARSLTQSITFTVGEHNEAIGDYRLSLFAICDVYYVLKTNRDNTEIIECKAEICARPNTQKFALDYAKDGDFNKSDDTGIFDRVLDYFSKFSIPAPTDFKVELDMQGGQGSPSSVQATYGKVLPSAHAPTRDGYAFVGYYSEKEGKGVQWYDHNMINTSKWDFYGGGKLYAYYTSSKVTLLREFDYTNDGGVQDDYGYNDKKIRTQLDTNYPSTVYFGFRNDLASGFDLALLKECGITHAKVTIRYYMREIDDGYQEVGLQYWDGKWVTFSQNKKMEHGSGYKDTSWGWETYVAPIIDLSLISSELRVRFGANGHSFNDWIFHKVEVTIEAVA